MDIFSILKLIPVSQTSPSTNAVVLVPGLFQGCSSPMAGDDSADASEDGSAVGSEDSSKADDGDFAGHGN